MGALVASGAGQEVCGRDRHHHPCENDEFQRGRNAAQREEDRQDAERDQAPEQPRRHESAVPHGRKHIVARRRVHKPVQKIANR